jgi:Holliday junction resolvase RusA-like endonuclease
MDYDYEFTIDCEPVSQGRPKARIIQPKGNRPPFVSVYDPSKSAKAKLEFAVSARQFAPEKLIDQAIRVDTTFYMPRPLYHYGTGRNSDKLKDSAPVFHTKRPDIDNLSKLVMDALTGVIWTDDSIVCKGFTEKVYDRKPRVEIRIKLLQESNATLF